MDNTLNNNNIDPVAAAIMDALAGPANFWEDAPIISMYTRAQAIADGVLIDVTSESKRYGFRISVVITDTLQRTLQGREAKGGRWYSYELLTLLGTLRRLIDQGGKATDRIHYQMPELPGEAPGEGLEVWAHIGPGDQGELCLTIMLEGED